MYPSSHLTFFMMKTLKILTVFVNREKLSTLISVVTLLCNSSPEPPTGPVT